MKKMLVIKLVCLFICLCPVWAVSGTASAEVAPLQNKQVLELWPSSAPGSKMVTFKPEIIERSGVAFLPDRVVTKVTNPTLTAFVPEKPNGVSVIVAPGGGYGKVVLDIEAVEVAKWLNPLGVTVFLLQYRLPCDPHVNAKDVPLQDGQRAVRLVRNNAAAWGLNANKIGFIGFSAAGHLAASISAQPDKKVYEPQDNIDKVSARPDFTILMFPVISMDRQYASAEAKQNLLGSNPSEADIEASSPDLNITKNAPPTFIALADDDSIVPPANGVLYYLGLKKAGVEAEMHIFREGGHGFGINRPGFGIKQSGKLPVYQWANLCELWLTRIGVLSE